MMRRHKFMRLTRAESRATNTTHTQALAGDPGPIRCQARIQGTTGGNDPADCDWPHCDCPTAAEYRRHKNAAPAAPAEPTPRHKKAVPAETGT